MRYVRLGNTSIEVSRLCFGGLIIGPLQADLSPDEGAAIILRALDSGINFIDTAELYGTYPHIRKAISKHKGRTVIATKSYAYSADQAKASVEKARVEMDLDVIDIFLMHEQESRLTLKGHREALEYYIDAKAKGIIRAVGVSTHNIEVVEACADIEEIDVIHPLVNIKGIGIGDGNVEQMLKAVKRAFDAGKGIYSMKPLGGGNLLNSFEQSMKFVLDIPFIHSVAVGMQTVEEVDMNIAVFEGKEIDEGTKEILSRKERHIHFDYWCSGCGKCAIKCNQNAISVIDGKALADEEKCVLCGYCSSVCPQFAIKIF